MPATKKPVKKITPKPRPGRAKTATETAAGAIPPQTAPAAPVTPQVKPARPRKNLALIIKIVSPIIIIIGLYFIIYPFWPTIQYTLWPPRESAAVIIPQDTNSATPAPVIHRAVSGGNKIIIPKIGVDMEMVEGTNEAVALNQGAWRMPQTSTPDQGGNTVITAHRFKYKPPSKETFYLLDKLTAGDDVTVNWQGFEYNYKVTSTKIVEPSAVEVLDDTLNPQITLITCTPLFTTKQRLIVIAEPV